MDCSITEYSNNKSSFDSDEQYLNQSRECGNNPINVPTLNSYYDCDHLSDLADGSLFEITASGCLSKSVFSAGSLVSVGIQRASISDKPMVKSEASEHARLETRNMIGKIEPYDYSSNGSLTARVRRARKTAASTILRRPVDSDLVPSGRAEALGTKTRADQSNQTYSLTKQKVRLLTGQQQEHSSYANILDPESHNDRDEAPTIQYHGPDNPGKSNRCKRYGLLGLLNLFNIFAVGDGTYDTKPRQIENNNAKLSSNGEPKVQAMVRLRNRVQTSKRQANLGGIRYDGSITVTNRHKSGSDKPVELLLGTVMNSEKIQTCPSRPKKLKSVKFTMPNEI